MTSLAPPRLFKSFWIAGYESACQVNRAGARLDMLVSTQHDRQAADDYALLATVGIRTARDGIRWNRVDQSGQFDFSSFAPMLEAAQQHGLQMIWSLCHYGWPDDVDIFAPETVDRFASYCRAVARFVADHSSEVPFYAPINEISFLCWAVAKEGIMFPYALGRGDELKRQLVRMNIAGCNALWSVDPKARIVQADPLIHVIPPRGRPDLAEAATAQ